MLENYLVFSIADHEFASSLIKVPIVLIAKKYIGATHLDDINEIRLPFEGAVIQLVDLAKLLSLKQNKPTLNSRLLVGQLEENFFGFIVDDVKEIIMLDDNEESYSDNFNEQSILNEITTEGRKLNIINIDKALEMVIESNHKSERV